MNVLLNMFRYLAILVFALQWGLASAAPLSARVVDQVSDVRLAGLAVDAYEKQADGSLLWKSKRVTDADGLVSFDLDGLGSGRVFVLKTVPYGYGVSSDEISATGSYRFWVGKLQVQVVDGVSGQPLAGQAVQLKRWQADGNHVYVMNAASDAQGWLKLDPPSLGVEGYVVTALSPSDGQAKISDKYTTKGPHTFVLGNEAVVVQLKDGVSGAGLAGKTVEAWEKLADGSQILRSKRVSDATGAARFDLDGLKSGRRYVLKSQPYLQVVESAEISAATVVELKAGALQVALLDGRNDQAFAWRDVQLMERLADGTLAVSGKYRTDGEGKVRLDPAGLGTRAYVIRAASLVDGTTKDSPVYATGGSYQFKVGGAGLLARVVDQVSDVRIAGLAVDAYEKQADGSLLWKSKRVTDADGLVSFDLDGLGSGKVFVLKTVPYGYGVSSDEISATGSYRFWVGKLQVQVVDGVSGQPLAGQAVQLKRWQADGNHVYVMNAASDAQGWLKLDPPSLGVEGYVVTALSPSDGQAKISDKYTTKGPHTFVLGNEAVVVQLKDGVSGAGLAGKTVEAWEKLADGSQILRSKRVSDATGAARFDLDGLKSGRRYVLKSQPYLQVVESAEISAATVVELKAGALQVALLDGRNDQAFAWRDVQLMERLADGTLAVSGKYRTDGEGKVRLDPAGLGTRAYVIRAASLVDGTTKDSPVYATGGSYQFKVGTAGALIRLVDHMTDAFISGQDVHAYEKLPSGALVWLFKRTTDNQGLANFDLDGLGNGKVYVFKANPYGFWARSDDIASSGGYRLRAGTSPVTVIDAAGGTPLGGTRVVAYEKRPDGSLRQDVQGVADAQGLIRFDLVGLGTGAEYVLSALNPFGDGNNYYSTVMNARGPYAFAVKQGETKQPDLVPPTVSIAEPVNGARVSVGGLRLQGVADDDKAIREIVLTLTLPSGTVLKRSATYRAASKTWFANTGVFTGESAGTVQVSVKAIDTSYNEADATVALNLLVDTTAPVLTVDSQTSGAPVPFGGFLVSGSVVDDTLGPTLTATLSGGGLAAAITQDVEVAQSSGRWTFVAAPEQVFTNEPLMLSLTARDGAGNTVARTLALQPSDTFSQAWHAVQRSSLGAAPDAYAEALQVGAPGFIQQQLAPDALDDSELQRRAAGWLNDGNQVATRFLRHAAYTRRQLQEAMTWFWDNHFNTNYYTHSNTDFERLENEAFRANALGNFRALVGVSAHSPAMLFTLDGRFNEKGRPNENYARELMELHSLGVNGGYTQHDVEEVARALTGWTVLDGVYYFNAAKHDTSAKTVLGRTIPAGGGQSDGETVLDLLATHPSTARFVCGKLVTFFVSDKPVDGLVTQCAATFLSQLASPDQIRQVVSTILSSPEFMGATYRNSKLKSPLKFVLGAVRQFAGEQAGDDLSLEVQRQGMPLFMCPVPTGFPETGDKWLSTSMLQTRSRFADRLLAYSPGIAQTQINISESMTAEGFFTGEGVAGRMLERMLGPTFVRRHLQLAMDVLTENGTYPYFASAPDAEIRLRRLGKALMTLPEYHYQ